MKKHFILVGKGGNPRNLKDLNVMMDFLELSIGIFGNHKDHAPFVAATEGCVVGCGIGKRTQIMARADEKARQVTADIYGEGDPKELKKLAEGIFDLESCFADCYVVE